MVDLIKESVHSGHMVFWEEVARDGAQARTLLTGDERVEVARANARIFGSSAPNQLIFAVGYPAIGIEEMAAIEYTAEQVEFCSLATHGRMLKKDVNLAAGVMKKAKYGRISFAVPISEKYSQIMMHQPAARTVEQSLDFARYTLDIADGTPVDAAFGGGSQCDPQFLADAAQALTEEGVATIKICDSAGELFPTESRELFTAVMSKVDSGVIIGAHLHNDRGLALGNTLEAIQSGVRVAACSWLGLGERVGLVHSEQLLFILGQEIEKLGERLGLDEIIWKSPPDLKEILPAAHLVSKLLGIPIRSTDPIITTNLNTIATGAYANEPGAFMPFNPETELGVEAEFVLSHLANKKVVAKIAEKLGYHLDESQAAEAMRWVKAQSFSRGESVIPIGEYSTFLEMIHLKESRKA